MDYPPPSHPTQLTKNQNPLKYTFDGHFLPNIPDDHDDSPRSSESEPRYKNSNGPASFQLIANTMLRMEIAQLEMMKKREIARLEAQRRQAELEHEMTQMMLQTQAHIASILCCSKNSSSRKRKRKSSSSIEFDHHSTTSTSEANTQRLNRPAFFSGTEGSMEAVNQLCLLSLLLSNMI